MVGSPIVASADLDFSIIIPTYNRPAQLESCLRSLEELEYPRERYEVVVVDDGGFPPLTAALGSPGEKLDLHILRQDNSGPGLARNRGAAHARGRYLAFTDDDCRPDPGWLGSFGSAFDSQPKALLGGRTVNFLDNSYSYTSQMIVQLVYDHYNPDPNDAKFFTSNNIAVSSKHFSEMGGFDAAFVETGGEDRELCDRWRHLGRRLVYVPSALVRHGHAMNLAGFWRQHFRYGRGAFHYHRRRKERGSGRLQDELGFYSRIPRLARGPLSQQPKSRAIAAVWLILVWQVANACGYFSERTRTWIQGGV